MLGIRNPGPSTSFHGFLFNNVGRRKQMLLCSPTFPPPPPPLLLFLHYTVIKNWFWVTFSNAKPSCTFFLNAWLVWLTSKRLSPGCVLNFCHETSASVRRRTAAGEAYYQRVSWMEKKKKHIAKHTDKKSLFTISLNLYKHLQVVWKCLQRSQYLEFRHLICWFLTC